ncbi:Transcription factor TGA6 [Acorus gramineus]|uniref:Transcription factor TGA6 n=1 Tax=Acorus gramineus TaxID=55184 RepID=A0AAV9BHH0_ACOGR|nr:Transcription factor TGA6 [Acorus gramineus]
MENHRVGEIGMSDSGPSIHTLSSYGGRIHGNITPSPATNFFDQEGSAYFGELEEALMQGVVGVRSHGERKPLYATRPPTLEIFPSWPMRFQQIQTPRGSSQSEGSTGSGSAQNTLSCRGDSQQQQQQQIETADSYDSPTSRKASDQSSELQQLKQVEILAFDADHQSKSFPNKKKGPRAVKDGKPLDAKSLRRLGQNREAAKKSRLRKKAYVQQLETSRIKLIQLEQELQRARSQGLFLGGGVDAGRNVSPAAAIFDMEYGRWLEEEQKHMSDLRGGLHARSSNGDLRAIVDECLTHHNDLFSLRASATHSDVLHLINGTWATPAERCFLWMGGFRPSDLIKVLMAQLDPLTEQQVMGMCSLQQSSEQAEEALSQGLERLQHSLADTVAGRSTSDDDVGAYMGQMTVALGILSNLENFIREADNMRQETLHQIPRILTIRQAARCFLAIGDYNLRLRALSSLWASRPQENSITEEHPSQITDIKATHQQFLLDHFLSF